jgi:ubiquinone/menaquinone biosynthesis C-methylase UbiE
MPHGNARSRFAGGSPRPRGLPAPGVTTPAPPTGEAAQLCRVPSDVFDLVRDGIGAFFERINGIDRGLLASDHLDPEKSLHRARILERYVNPKGKKLLEVGSGCGTNLVVWSRAIGIDAYGVEPGGPGFQSSFRISRRLLEVNGLDAERVMDAKGESLPFSDETFDIVYSANVLEHTDDPLQVLEESLRVLKTGGILHFEIPNFLSYYEGHYSVLQPPILRPWILPKWVQIVFGRDPAFARTLRSEINPIWCRRAVAKIRKRYPVRLVSTGEEIFLDRLKQGFQFETVHVKKRLSPVIRLFSLFNRGNRLAKVVVALQGHYPIYLTVEKGDCSASPPLALGDTA